MTPTTVDSGQPVSLALRDAYRMLRDNIYVRLDDAEHLSQLDHWNPQDLDLLRKVIPDLTIVIRGLVVQHESDDAGKCKTCNSPWPCAVTETIHELMRNPDRSFDRILTYVNSR